MRHTARLFYAQGCIETWHLRVQQVDGEWRVDGLTRGSYE